MISVYSTPSGRPTADGDLHTLFDASPGDSEFDHEAVSMSREVTGLHAENARTPSFLKQGMEGCSFRHVGLVSELGRDTQSDQDLDIDSEEELNLWIQTEKEAGPLSLPGPTVPQGHHEKEPAGKA